MYRSLVFGTGLLAALCSVSACAAEVGKVILASGETRAVRGGQSVPLARGAAIEDRDVLETGPKSSMQVRFADESIMALKEQSRLAIEEFRYSGRADGEERAAFRLLKGAVRTITGVIGRTDNDRYRMSTHVSTVGIRGTMYALGVCTGDCVNTDGSLAADGAYGSVLGPSFGTNKLTSINNAGPSVIDQGQHFHVATLDSPTTLLLEPPGFLSASLPGKPAALAAQTGAATGVAVDSRPNTLPPPINQIDATTATSRTIAGPQNLQAGGLPTGIHTATATILGGFVPVGSVGIVRGQLVWTTTADMDLHMITPTNQQVFFGNRTVVFGGATAMLDLDNVVGSTNPANPAVENIAVTGTVPAGNYTFFVRNFRSSGPTTAPILRVTGDNNVTGRTYNVPALAGGQQSANHVVTRNPNGTVTYSP